ncbi:MAG: SGNH/GDSL hydrolase family protein [Lachnospiraceae bacterium]|nr:SGNH/GDSL hydrolase family protein [Lachnospiraceae bacterium]
MITEKLPQVNLRGVGKNTEGAYRIKNMMKKAARGGEICIGFLGGSITLGCLASSPEKCYAHKVFEWFEETFPKTNFKYVNAGIGATDSQFGCARAEDDLLSFDPDICFVEYSVNDECEEHYHETYEGLVRKILKSSPDRALMLVWNFRYDNGKNAEKYHSMIADRYNVPAVSLKTAILPSLESGEVDRGLLSSDGLHPNDTGHSLVASVIISVLEDIRKHMDEVSEADAEMPEPETENAYEDSERYRNDNSDKILVECNGFTADASAQSDITDIFKRGWTASEKGSFIEFKVTGSCIGIQYRKTIQKPAPIAKVTVDSGASGETVLDANFEEDWGDKLQLDTVLDHGKSGEHTVRIELTEVHEEDVLPFYLVSVIASGN